MRQDRIRHGLDDRIPDLASLGYLDRFVPLLFMDSVGLGNFIGVPPDLFAAKDNRFLLKFQIPLEQRFDEQPHVAEGGMTGQSG